MQTLAELSYEPAITIPPAASLDVALHRLLEREATELYVTDNEHRLLGIVPDFALLKAHLAGQWSDVTVEQLMSHSVLCFTCDTPLADALRVFREGQHSRAAILQHGRLIGQITRRTLLRRVCQTQPFSTPVAAPKFLQTIGTSPLTRSPA